MELFGHFSALAYLIAAVLFILALRGLSSPESSSRGNLFGMLGMAIAIVTTILAPDVLSYGWILLALMLGAIVGVGIALKIPMTAMPQLVAAFHSLVGLSAVLVASAAFSRPDSFNLLDVNGQIFIASRIEMALGVVIGAITFSGSIIAFGKLQGLVSGSPLIFVGQHYLNALFGLAILGMVICFGIQGSAWLFWAMTAIAFVLGFLIVVPIGGADMPVVVSMLNSYSGWAAAGVGFTLHNNALIVTGALVGSSGAILSYIMCKSMNRSFLNVLLGGYGGDTAAAGATAQNDKPVKQGSPEDAAFIMKNAGSVIIVPGYGMAVAQAQHVLREMTDELKKAGVKVSFAIHPVAGRMPGHMNVLLAEANIPYDEVFELEEINSEFAQTDVAFVIGANDVTNPAAKTDPASPIFGMPILDVEKAKTVLFVKRGMAAGYAGVQNELFFRDNTMMLFGDAKKVVEGILQHIN